MSLRARISVSVLVAGLALSTATCSRAGGAAPLSRNEVWRLIFARPGDVPGAAGGDPSLAARVDLGRDLFRDRRLSGAGTMACASCHDPSQSFTDGRPTGVGAGGAVLTRNVPALFNLAWSKSYFWDGRAATLEEQARFPLLDRHEMAGDFREMASRLEGDPAMVSRFARAFPERTTISETSILAAIADFERSIVSGTTRFDLWVGGDDDALSPLESRGFGLFVGKAGCVSCHGGWRLTDDSFHDIGLPGRDPGRGAVAGGVPGLAQFKTPSLREVGRTAPYMHDGSLATLAAVIDHYAGRLTPRPSLDANIVRTLRLDAGEKEALLAFLLTLTSDAAGPQRD